MVLFAVTGVGHASVTSGDVNGDGKAGIDDVVGLIDNLLSQPQTPDPAVGDWVDLGLPSGTIWATRNVGASTPEDYGDYFAWGETVPKSVYNWDTYKWYQKTFDADGTFIDSGFTKYCTNSNFGYNDFVNNMAELDPEDDAACAQYLGGRMPSLEQIQELIDNCTWQWTQRNGVNGQLFTGPNGNTMFLPAASGIWGDSIDDVGSVGWYWSRTLNTSDPSAACSLNFNMNYWVGSNSGLRGSGYPVRAVRVS